MEIIRHVVLAAFLMSGVLALGSWAVTTRRLNPLGRPARLIRTVTDPVLEPLERLLLRRGGNPQSAPWWLVGIAVFGGVAVLVLAEWVLRLAGGLVTSAQSGPRGMVRALVALAGQLVSIALLIRVLGSWIGRTRFTPWMRPFYVLTDWIVAPVRRFVPPFASFDFSPVIAWLLLQWLILPLLLAVL